MYESVARQVPPRIDVLNFSIDTDLNKESAA